VASGKNVKRRAATVTAKAIAGMVAQVSSVIFLYFFLKLMLIGFLIKKTIKREISITIHAWLSLRKSKVADRTRQNPTTANMAMMIV
jgi:hypothetical protein